jgi:hypothetical protein
VLRSPLSQGAIRHYALQGNGDIIVQGPDGIILFLKERQPRYSSLGFDYLVLPLKIVMRRLNGVPLLKLTEMEEEIMQQRSELQDPSVELPRYEEDPNLPVINEWVGIVRGDKRDVIRNILEATAEDKIMHNYQIDGGDDRDKAFFFKSGDDIRGRSSKLSCKFSIRPCLDFDCALCHEHIELPYNGIFYRGEKLENIDIALNRFKIQELHKIQKILAIIGMTLQSASLMADA